MIELAKKNNPKASFKVLDGRNISSLGETFDALICGFFLPYLSREESNKLISDAAALLNPGGVFYLSTMEGDYDTSGWKSSSDGKYQTFTHYHSSEDLNGTLLRNGFEPLKRYRKEYAEAKGTLTTDLVLISQKRFV
jgi:SAM-dependent methyltransferase